MSARSTRTKAGVIADIDVLRASVELQTQQQRLIAAENQLAIDKLALARVIGLPKGQLFEPTDAVPFAPLDGITLEQALERAVATGPTTSARERGSGGGAAAAIRGGGELSLALHRRQLRRHRKPQLRHLPRDVQRRSDARTCRSFRATRVRADHAGGRRSTQTATTPSWPISTGRIDEQVRTALLNLRSSSDLVTVAESNLGPRQPDPRAGAGSVRRGGGRQPRGRPGAGIGGRGQPVLHREPLCAQPRERSLSRRRSASPSSRRCKYLGSTVTMDNSATHDPANEARAEWTGSRSGPAAGEALDSDAEAPDARVWARRDCSWGRGLMAFHVMGVDGQRSGRRLRVSGQLAHLWPMSRA